MAHKFMKIKTQNTSHKKYDDFQHLSCYDPYKMDIE